MESTTTSPLRHAIIGAGAGIFSLHQRGLSLETTQLVALCDVNPAAQEKLADYGVPFYTDHKQMLAETRPDVVVVITPHPFHAPLAIDALNAGCHVLVEKPIAVQVAEADAMLTAAERAGKLLAVNFQQRHRPEIKALHTLIQSGQLGEIQYVDLTATWPRTHAYYSFAGWRGTWNGEGGGVLMNQSPHNLDLLCHLVGLPNRVHAWTRTNIHKIRTEDTVQAMLAWSNGAVGNFHTSTAETGKPFWFELIATNGTVQIGPQGLVYRRFETDIRDHIATSNQHYQGPAMHEEPLALSEGAGDHEAVYRNFHDAILHGAPLLTDGASAAQSLELANAMIYSSYTGDTVEMPLDRAKYGELLADLKEKERAISG